MASVDAGVRIERAATRAGDAAPRRVTISLRHLLLLYLVVPATLLAAGADVLWLDGAVRAALPRRPEQYFLYELFLGWPHIVASTVILTTNREYIGRYKHRLLVVSAIVVAFFGIGEFALHRNVLFVVAATVTIVHVLKQQVGIGRGAVRPDAALGRLYTVWGWTAIAAGVVLYNGLYLSWFDRHKPVLVAGGAVLAGACSVLAAAIHRRTEQRLGRWWLWANTSMVLVGVLFYWAGYGAFAIIVPRVVHDCTAFAFYVAHDVNKHGATPGNGLYRLARRLPAGVYWVTPVLAVGIAVLLNEWGDGIFHWLTSGVLEDAVPKAISLGLLGYLGMMHYYYESFTWKRDSPYRQHVSLRA